MISKVINWWMALEPGKQYMYWIIAFCAMLSVGVAGIIVMAELGMLASASVGWLALFAGTIGGFISLFMFVVLFFAIFYPMLRKDEPEEPK
jgi:hypothetical protein